MTCAKSLIIIPLACLLWASGAFSQPAAELNFLAGQVDGRELNLELKKYLRAKAEASLSERRRRVAAIGSQSDLDARRRYIREKILASIGTLPQRTPLNAKITGTVDRGDYRIEKLVFESQPKFYVTANLYVPQRGKGPYPAVLFPLGHEAGAKAHTAWQHVLVSFAKKGFVGLAWDTIGQGERVQMWDADLGESKVVRSTTEHTMQGLQCLLVGDALARYTIWDGIRALDYLASRPEVDPERIGVTGNSGGGTHTAYLAALDDRLKVAAPSCYLTGYGRLLDTIGPQDAEQCMTNFLSDGLDHADFVLAFAPKPYRVLAAIRDFFSIAGARDVYEEAKTVYERVGAGDRIAMTEADDGHGYTLPRRLAAYDWFSRWLLGKEDSAPEPEVTIAAEDELWATTSGQVATSLGGETVATLNQSRLAAIRRGAVSRENVQRFLGYQAAEKTAWRTHGTLEGKGCRIQKIVYESEPAIRIPALLYVPEGPPGRKPAVVYAHGRGKAAGHEEALALAQRGALVLSLDARGLGETRAAGERYGSDWPRLFGDFENAMTAMLTGKTLVAMRAEDISRGAGVLLEQAGADPDRLTAIGREGAAVAVLHAAALDGRFKRLGLERMVVSYESVVKHAVHKQLAEDVIPGVLRHYDLPDLVRLAGSAGVVVVDAVNPVGQPLPLAEVTRAYGGEGKVRAVRRRPGDTAASLFAGLWEGRQ